MNDKELTYARAIAVAVETEEAAKVAKETAQGSMGNQTVEVKKVQDVSSQRQQHPTGSSKQRSHGVGKSDFPKGTCMYMFSMWQHRT